MVVRTALREFAFNARRRGDTPPEIDSILRWVERNCLTMAAWEDPSRVDAVLRAVSSRLDGSVTAASTIKRSRRVLDRMLEHAVKQNVLRTKPLPKGRGTTPKTSLAVDKRSLINRSQAAGLLGWVRRRPRGGARLHAFFATMYWAGPRPEEVVAMYVMDARLPPADAGDQMG
ncbi:hypothetical protein ACFCZ1_20930 [Streptomyces sp. NPDC056224]|uniref:hypothetical protein n=1 Tax=Streptomyces sp. NPDC056224 TaxID=3345750 RepID=UPI0035E2340D